MAQSLSVCAYVYVYVYAHGVMQILIKLQKNAYLSSETDIKNLNQEWEATFTPEVFSLLRHPHRPEPLLSLAPPPTHPKAGRTKILFRSNMNLRLDSLFPLSVSHTVIITTTLSGHLHPHDGRTLVQSRAAQRCDSKVNLLGTELDLDLETQLR